MTLLEFVENVTLSLVSSRAKIFLRWLHFELFIQEAAILAVLVRFFVCEGKEHFWKTPTLNAD